MTDDELTALEERAAKALPGPWCMWWDNSRWHLVGQGGQYPINGDVDDTDNRHFIAAANPAAVRELVAEVRRLRAKLALVDAYYEAREAYHRAVDDGGTLIDKAVVADYAAERMDAAWRAK